MIQDKGAEVVMVGMPIVKNPTFRRRIAKANDVVKSATESTNTHFLSIWNLSATRNGHYREEIRVRGQTRPFRQSDGVHFSRSGAKHVAKGIFNELQSIYNWKPPTAAPNPSTIRFVQRCVAATWE